VKKPRKAPFKKTRTTSTSNFTRRFPAKSEKVADKVAKRADVTAKAVVINAVENGVVAATEDVMAKAADLAAKEPLALPAAMRVLVVAEDVPRARQAPEDQAEDRFRIRRSLRLQLSHESPFSP
jgi:hypothetical protein